VTAVLHEVHPDQGDELPVHVCLPGAEGAVEGGAGSAVCELRVSGVRVERLSGLVRKWEKIDSMACAVEEQGCAERRRLRQDSEQSTFDTLGHSGTGVQVTYSGFIDGLAWDKADGLSPDNKCIAHVNTIYRPSNIDYTS
jgi:hypothetical protein